MKLSMQKMIMDGEMIPRGYGLAWVDHASYHMICLPFPINHIAREIRAWWHRVRNVEITDGEKSLMEAQRIRDRMDQMYSVAADKVYSVAYNDGRKSILGASSESDLNVGEIIQNARRDAYERGFKDGKDKILDIVDGLNFPKRGNK